MFKTKEAVIEAAEEILEGLDEEENHLCDFLKKIRQCSKEEDFPGFELFENAIN